MDTASVLLLISRAGLLLCSLCLLIRCLRSLLRERYDPETWAFLRVGGETMPLTHWENLLGSSRGADLRLSMPEVRRFHAVLRRNDAGDWRIYNVFARRGVKVNGQEPGRDGLPVKNGDQISLGRQSLRFLEADPTKREKLESGRLAAGRRISPALTLLLLTLFQLFLLLQHSLSAAPEDMPAVILAFSLLILLEWSCYNAMRVIGRSGFEVETLAFYLTSLGFSVAASSAPEQLYKQALLALLAVLLFLLLGLWLRSLKRTEQLRLPAALAALALLGVNLLFGREINGARNWIFLGDLSLQPSELVKAAYVYCSASTLDKLYRRGNLFGFIAFSALCVGALALLGDFGTALIFFVSFLVIAFIRSGSIATVFLALAGAGMAGMLAVSVKPHIARRFASWGHAWADRWGAGYQQTRAMSAAAAGGLFGKGAGAGWLRNVRLNAASNTDLVFGLLCEELGLLIGMSAMAALLILAFFALRSVRNGRSAYYAVAACAAMTMLLFQMGLNVFGSMDLLPFTGVPFPFVSKGGSSLLCCWMLMAFIKGADNRRDASFAVRPGLKLFRSRKEAGT
jgi:cell division protein FtsW (lipid II flippase)